MEKAVKWSNSSINILRQCNRRYYLGYILATHGRKNPVRRKAYELKKMQNLTMWKGSVVDKFMEKTIIPLIEDKQPMDFTQLAKQCVALAQSQFLFSEFEMYRDPGIKKGEADEDFCILDIHELGILYTDAELAEAYTTIRQTIENIPLIEMPDGKLLLTYLQECQKLVPNINTWPVTVGKARVTPQIDLVAYHDYKPVVIDWKLSESFVSDYSGQLVICGLTVYLKRLESRDREPYEYEDITLYEVNLLKGIVKQHDFSEERVNETIDRISLTADDLMLLYKKYDDADPEDFELTENEASCKFCNFQTLCTHLLLNNNHYDEKAYNEFVRANQRA
jgi:hypothetical protein